MQAARKRSKLAVSRGSPRASGVTVVVLAFESREPGLYLALPEAELAADPEAGRSAALAPQVIERLGADLCVWWS